MIVLAKKGKGEVTSRTVHSINRQDGTWLADRGTSTRVGGGGHGK